MEILKESFEETLESERQAVISAQQFAIALQNEMSQESTACDSWTTEVMILTKDVEEDSRCDPQKALQVSIFHRLPLLFGQAIGCR